MIQSHRGTRRNNFRLILIALIGCHSIACGQTVEPPLDPYKRIHQDALRQILAGEPQTAIDRLLDVLKGAPDDAESFAVMARAHIALQQPDAAVKCLQQAVQCGLPLSRILAGKHTGLESLRERPEIKAMGRVTDRDSVQGPLLGNVTPQGASLWIRASAIAQVRVEVTLAGQPDSAPHRFAATPDPDRDDTALVGMDGLESATEYDYRVQLLAEGGAIGEWWHGGRFRTLPKSGAPVKFRLAFGGGAGYVPQHESMWQTIADQHPDMLLLLGDNVYSDAPKIPAMQHYCYYRRQSRPEFRNLIGQVPVYCIWDDHDFGTNDCSGGPEIDRPAWKLPVYRVFRDNWNNPGYGGGDQQPGCYYDFQVGDVHFVMLDGRYYRDLQPSDGSIPTMLGPVQRQWLLNKLESSTSRVLVLCSPVPWVYAAKGDSRDTWNGFHDERKLIFDCLSRNRVGGVVLMSADRHRSDLWKIERSGDYPLFEFSSSRLTNQHVHPEMKAAEFSYNRKQSFGTVDFDTTLADPTVTYRIVSIDGEAIYSVTVALSQLQSPGE